MDVRRLESTSNNVEPRAFRICFCCTGWAAEAGLFMHCYDGYDGLSYRYHYRNWDFGQCVHEGILPSTPGIDSSSTVYIDITQ